ncbi:MAG TPA: serpin family protein [Nitrosopumilaceae archaeon]|nr:serpin family protein [Nitrosopumilaceae archaeon]
MEEFAYLNNEFSFEMFSKLTKEIQVNAFISPYSISSAISMMFEGARGKTQKEIGSVFHFIMDDRIRRKMTHEFLLELNNSNKNFILYSANALWIQIDFPVLGEFGETIEKNYLAKIENLDFRKDSEGSRQKINRWTEEKTNGKIKELFSRGSIPSNTLAVITNAVYFLGKWARPFDSKRTRKEDFRISKQEIVRIPMMEVTALFGYTSTDELEILKIPYQGGDLSMFVLLPRTLDLLSLEKKLSLTTFNQWKDGLWQEQIQVFLPKFSFESKYDLVGNLEKMGISSAFDPKNANFEGISGGKDLFLNNVIHRTFIGVDEKGTEAAAATGTVMISGRHPRLPKIFRVDHPFIFLIVSDKTGMILFMGKVVNPLI